MLKLSVFVAVCCALLLAAHPLRAEGDETTIPEASSAETTDAPPAEVDATTMATEEETTEESEEPSTSEDVTSTAMVDTSTTTRSRVKTKRPFPNLSPYDRLTPNRDANKKDENKFLLIIPFPKMDAFPPSPSRPPSPWGARPQYGSEDEDEYARKTQRPMKMPFPNFAPFPNYSPYPPRRPSSWSSRRPPIDDDDNIKGRAGEESDDDDYRRTIVKRYQRDVEELNQETSDSPLLARLMRSASPLELNGNAVNKDGGDNVERPKRCSKSRDTTDAPATGENGTRKSRSSDVEETDPAGSVDLKSKPKPKKYRMRAAKMASEITEDANEETTTSSNP